MPQTRDPREVQYVTLALQWYQRQKAEYLTAGYPVGLAMRLTLWHVHRAFGIDVTGYVVDAACPLPEDDAYPVRELSLRYGLEHDGSALNTLLERYDYQWHTSMHEWILTPRADAERVGFLAPSGRWGTPCLLWKPAVVEQVIALEQLQQSLTPDPGPTLLQRQYFSPRELGQRVGLSTRRMNQRLADAGYQAHQPHGRHRRWEPTPKAWRETGHGDGFIFGQGGLEWALTLVQRVLMAQGVPPHTATEK